ncbi:MAG: multidrug ABC transporter ATP-binding protein [Leifsonia xyli]|nr:MAG: multidrug ABC transporter ATP-binding protein [Leifsonia xyli]
MLKQFFAYYRPHRGLFLLDFGAAVLSGLLELGFPIAVKVYIDDLLPRQDWTLILLAAVGLLAVYVANTGLMAVVTYWGHVLGINIETELRRKAFDHLQKLSFAFFDNQKTGHLVGRLTKDLEEIGEVAHHGPEDLFIAVMTLIGAFVLMFAVNVQLALVTAAIIPVTGWVTTRYGARMMRNARELYGRVGAFNARIEENVGGIRVVQAFANEDHERALFAEANDGYRSTKLSAFWILTASNALSYMSMRVTQVIVMLTGSWLVIAGELSHGGFIGFLLLVGVFFRPVEKINAVIETYPKGAAGFKRYQEFLSTAPDIVDSFDAIEVERLTGNIVYRNVDFAYADKTVLADVNLEIPAGETLAFVGPSGAGKTTICSLLARFYDVRGGSITIDGVDIRHITLSSLRRQIGVVQQEIFLFAGTIRENVAYGRLSATDEEVMEAIRRARLGDLISGLPEGLDTVVGERGVKLSGGQKQRLSIARIFLKDPPILILDEATSALDTQTENEIQIALRELAINRTTLVIAHRLSTIRHADRIAVICRTGIVELGRHEDLLARGGPYKSLYQSQ